MPEPSQPVPRPPTSRRRSLGRRRRLVARISLLLLLAAPVIAWPILKSRLELRLIQAFEQNLEEALGGTASVGSVSVAVLSLRVEVKDLRWADTDTGVDELIHIPKFVVGLSARGLWGLTGGRVHIRELSIQEPLVELSGQWLRSLTPTGSGDGWDVRIDRLQLLEGRFVYDDRAVPLELEAQRLDIRGNWDPKKRWLATKIVTVFRLATEGFSAPLEGELTVSLDMDEHWLRFRDLQWQTPVGTIGADFDIDLDHSGRTTGVWNALLDLGEIKNQVGRQLETLSGMVGIEGTLLRDSEGWILDGRAQGTEVRYGRLYSPEIAGHLSMGPGYIKLDEYRGSLFGGTVKGDLKYTFPLGGMIDLSVSGERIELEPLLRWLGQPLPLGARGTVTAALTGPPNDLSLWDGAGSFLMHSNEADETFIQAAGEGEFRLEDGLVIVTSPRVETSGWVSSMHLETPLGRQGDIRLQLSGNTVDAARTQAATLRILKKIGLDAGEISARPLAGQGSVAVDVTLGKAHRSIFLDFDLAEGGFDGEPFRQATLSLALLPDDTLEIRNLVLDGLRQRLNFSMVMDAERNWTHISGDAKWVTLDWLLPWLSLESLQGQGAVSGEIELTREPQKREASGSLQLHRPTLSGISFREISADIDGTLEAIIIREQPIDDGNLAGTVRLDVPWDGSASTLILEKVGLDLAELTQSAEKIPELGGTASLSGSLRFESEGAEGTLNLEVSRFSINGFDVGEFSGAASVVAGGMKWRVDEQEKTWSLSGSHELAAPFAGSWQLTWNNASFAILDSPDARGLLVSSGTFRSDGPVEDYLHWQGEGSIESLEVRIGSKRLQAVRPVRLELTEGLLEIEGLEVDNLLAEFRAKAELSLSTAEIRLAANGRLDLGLPATIFPDIRASGALTFDVQGDGRWEDPSWSGTLRLKDGRAKILGFPHRIDSVEAEAELKGRRLSGLHWDGSLGGGEMSGGGTVDWNEDLRYALSFRARQSRIAWPEGFLGLVDVDARLGGTTGDGLLSGSVTLRRGEYREEFRWTDWLGLGAREFTTEDPSTLPDWIRLDLAIVGEEDIWFRNDAAELETRVDLQIGGSLPRPEYSGRIGLYEGGRLRVRDVDYRIVSGSLDFLGTETLDPYVNLVAETTIDRYLIRLALDGSLEQFDYKLTSTPTLREPDIIALLTTGNTLEDLSGSGSNSSLFNGDLAANYFAGALTDPFEKQIRRLTGFERVRIDPLLSGSSSSADPTARVTLGKEVAKNLFLIYSTQLDSTEGASYKAEWQASRKFRVVAEQDPDGVIGGDFLFVDRFGGHRKRDESEPSVPSDSSILRSSPLSIASLNLEGVPPELEVDLLAVCGLELGLATQRAEIFDARERILTELVRRGHLSAEVQVDRVLTGSDSLALRFRVDPGPVTVLQADGVPKRLAKQLLRQAREAWREAIRREDSILEAEDAMREWLQADGYFTADVYGESTTSEGREVVVFQVDKGNKVHVDQVTINGADRISEDRIRKQLLTRKGNLFSSHTLVPKVLAEDLRAIKNLYRHLGFLAVRIPPPVIRLSTDGQRATVTVNIEEGIPFPVRGISLTEELPIEESEIRGELGVLLDEPFSPGRLVDGVGAVRRMFDRRGFPEARIQASLDRGIDYVLVHLDIEPGPRVILQQISIEIAGATREEIIRREITLTPGDPISRQTMQDTRRRLYRVGNFRSVAVDYVSAGDASGRYVLKVRTEDAEPISITLGAGYDTEGDVRGSFSIAHDNLFGYNLGLGLQTRASGTERLAQVTASKGRLFGSDWEGLLNFGFERLDEIGYVQERRFSALRFEIPRGPQLRTFIRLNFQKVDLLDVVDPLAVKEEKLENIQLADLGYSVVRDGRDDPFSPTRGNFISGEARVFTSALGSEADFLKITGAFSTVYPFTERQAWASGVRVGLSLPYGGTSAVPLPERFFAGGESTIRGFSRDGVGPQADGIPSGGEVLWVINEEYRFPIWAALGGVFFYDAGNVFETTSEFDPLELRHAIGGGLRLQTPIGPLRIEYGHKLKRRTGESAGELFFSIGVPF